MSRDLTTWSHKHKYSPEQQSQIERLMADRGVSEPVARNMLKSATLGIGPLVQEGIADRYLKDVRPSALSIRDRHEKRPPDRDMFLAPAPDFKAAKRQKMREQEALLKAQEEARENEIAEEEQMRKDRQKQKASRSVGVPGIAKLGPVLAREEEIDPLPPKPERPEDPFDPEEELPPPPSEPEPPRVQIMANKKPGGYPDDGRRKPKKKKRRRRGPDSSDSSAHDNRGGRSRSRGRADGSAGGARGRSPSASREKGGPNGLMSEAEVRRRLGQERKSGRGSERAKQRIQKEQEAWEEAKKNNKEYWRPPKHCLCFAPETARKRLSG